jgi:hypothetical protein
LEIGVGKGTDIGLGGEGLKPFTPFGMIGCAHRVNMSLRDTRRGATEELEEAGDSQHRSGR